MNVANTADDFDWERAQAETLSYGTGPIVDHTLGSSDGQSRLFSKQNSACTLLAKRHKMLEIDIIIFRQNLPTVHEKPLSFGFGMSTTTERLLMISSSLTPAQNSNHSISPRLVHVY